MHPKELIPTSATKPPKYKVGDCVSLKEKYLMELKEISIHDFSPENFFRNESGICGKYFCGFWDSFVWDSLF